METILFHESQHMVGSLPSAGIIALLVCFVIYAVNKRQKISRVLSLLVILFAVVIVVILVTLRLDSVYYTDRVEFQFISIYSAKYEVISLDTVTKTAIIQYGREDYGGWGVKGNADTRVYTASGDQGIMFTFKNGKHFMLGTHQPDSLYTHLKDKYPF